MTINLTENAAKKLEELLKKAVEETKEQFDGVRLSVIGGGCSGFSYSMAFDKPKEKDKVYENYGMKVLVDPKSYIYLNGVEIDYVEGLMGGGFNFKNPNSKGTCGCGSSFQA